MVTVSVRRVVWPRSVRIIRTIYPPIDLFEEIADPADWEAVASAEAKFNQRLHDSIAERQCSKQLSLREKSRLPDPVSEY